MVMAAKKCVFFIGALVLCKAHVVVDPTVLFLGAVRHRTVKLIHARSVWSSDPKIERHLFHRLVGQYTDIGAVI